MPTQPPPPTDPDAPHGVVLVFQSAPRGAVRLADDPALSERLGHPLLTRDCTLALVRAAQAGNRAAADDLLRYNQRLIYATMQRLDPCGLGWEDLMQEGGIGLLRAIPTFDLNAGFAFSTYATYWVYQAMQRAAYDMGRTIRVPVHVSESLSVYRRYREAHPDVTDPVQIARDLDWPVERVRRVQAALLAPLSLDQPTTMDDGDRGDALGDRLSDPTASTAMDAALNAAAGSQLRDMLDALGERERHIVELRFGFGEHAPHTLEEIGQRIGLTRERARQLIAESLRRLRQYADVHNITRESL